MFVWLPGGIVVSEARHCDTGGFVRRWLYRRRCRSFGTGASTSALSGAPSRRPYGQADVNCVHCDQSIAIRLSGPILRFRGGCYGDKTGITAKRWSYPSTARRGGPHNLAVAPKRDKRGHRDRLSLYIDMPWRRPKTLKRRRRDASRTKSK